MLLWLKIVHISKHQPNHFFLNTVGGADDQLLVPCAMCPCGACIFTSYKIVSSGCLVPTLGMKGKALYLGVHPNSAFLIFQVSPFISCIFRNIQCNSIVFCRRTQITFSTHAVGLKICFGLSTQIPNAAAHVHGIEQGKTQLSPVLP